MPDVVDPKLLRWCASDPGWFSSTRTVAPGIYLLRTSPYELPHEPHSDQFLLVIVIYYCWFLTITPRCWAFPLYADVVDRWLQTFGRAAPDGYPVPRLTLFTHPATFTTPLPAPTPTHFTWFTLLPVGSHHSLITTYDLVVPRTLPHNSLPLPVCQTGWRPKTVYPTPAADPICLPYVLVGWWVVIYPTGNTPPHRYGPHHHPTHHLPHPHGTPPPPHGAPTFPTPVPLPPFWLFTILPIAGQEPALFLPTFDFIWCSDTHTPSLVAPGFDSTTTYGLDFDLFPLPEQTLFPFPTYPAPFFPVPFLGHVCSSCSLPCHHWPRPSPTTPTPLRFLLIYCYTLCDGTPVVVGPVLVDPRWWVLLTLPLLILFCAPLHLQTFPVLRW